MKKLTVRELEELRDGDAEIDAITRKEQKQKKKKPFLLEMSLPLRPLSF